MVQDGTVRVGVIGVAGMGAKHADNFRHHGHEVVACADIDADTREQFAEEFDAETYEVSTEMLDGEDLDVVVVATPHKFHADDVIAAFERDLNVVCEKPLSNTLEDAERMVDAWWDSEGFGITGFKNRYSVAADLFKSYQRNGIFGDVTHIEATFTRRRGKTLGDWFTRKDVSGGGALLDTGVHMIDFSMFLMGFPEIEEITGTTRQDFINREDYALPEARLRRKSNPTTEADVEDCAHAFIRLEEGRTISLDIAWAANREFSRDLVVWGTEAGATLELGGESLTLNRTSKDGLDHFVDSELTGEREYTWHRAMDGEFAEAILSGEPPELNTFPQGLTVQRIVDAIYRSDKTGSAVTFD